MGRIIRTVRREKSKNFLPNFTKNWPFDLPKLSEEEIANGVSGMVTDFVHERGFGTPQVTVELDVPAGEKRRSATFSAIEGLRVGQRISLGATAVLEPGNIVPLGKLSEGLFVCNVEETPGDLGRLVKASGNYAVIISQEQKEGKTRIKLPSGHKKLLPSNCLCVIGIVAGGGRASKPLLKASRAHFKNKHKSTIWPRVRGVAMNPVDHPHGGGNHQHVGHPTTVSKHMPPNKRVGLISARRTGLRRGKKQKI